MQTTFGVGIAENYRHSRHSQKSRRSSSLPILQSLGHPLRATSTSAGVLFFDKDLCRYEQDGYTQRLRNKWERRVGCVDRIDHDDPQACLVRWSGNRNESMSSLEVEKLLRGPANCFRDCGPPRLMIWRRACDLSFDASVKRAFSMAGVAGITRSSGPMPSFSFVGAPERRLTPKRRY